MDVLTLNLHKPLEWSPAAALEAGIATPADALKAVAAAPEDAEVAMAWQWNDVVDETGDDGPHAVRPLPGPGRISAAGLAAAAGTASPGPAAPPAAERLEPGRYVFVQTRVPAGPDDPAIDDWLANTVEWFARESWWIKAKATGPLIVRLVHEDHKTAVQLLRQIP